MNNSASDRWLMVIVAAAVAFFIINAMVNR